MEGGAYAGSLIGESGGLSFMILNVLKGVDSDQYNDRNRKRELFSQELIIYNEHRVRGHGLVVVVVIASLRYSLYIYMILDTKFGL